ncbi:MAG: phage major capsid protein, P2 family [Flavobacteriales bacterium]|nr:phage major capsid protein, P2 family [Flavobacteriales bacterium]
MRKLARDQFNAMCAAMAKTYGVDSVSTEFAASATIQQILMDQIVESIAFLKQINILAVDDMSGEKVLGSVSTILGKRTDTDTTDRSTSDPLNLDGTLYHCKFTEYDVHMKWKTMDAWSKFPNLHEKFMEYSRLAQAHSRIRTGWLGITAATVTDSVTYPLGEDTNIGWLQHIRNFDGGSHMLAEGVAASGAIKMGEGAGADYPNLDSFVQDVKGMVSPLFRESSDLVAIIGSELLGDDKAQLYAAQGSTPSEKERIELATVTRTYAGLPAHQIPFFPARGLFITPFRNISVYYQDGSIRQNIEDNSKRSRVEHYNSVNECYVVEDFEKVGAAESDNVQLWDGTGWS